MFFANNLFIDGNRGYGLKLMEGIREFDLIMIGQELLEFETGEFVKKINNMLSSDGKIGVKVKSNPMKNVFGFYGLQAKETLTDNAGETWVIYGKEIPSNVPFDRKTSWRSGRKLTHLYIDMESSYEVAKLTADNIVDHYLGSSSSVLAIEVDISRTVKSVLSSNYRDAGSRTYVVINSDVDDAFENIKKQAMIYEVPVDRIILEATEEVA